MNVNNCDGLVYEKWPEQSRFLKLLNELSIPFRRAPVLRIPLT